MAGSRTFWRRKTGTFKLNQEFLSRIDQTGPGRMLQLEDDVTEPLGRNGYNDWQIPRNLN